VARISSATSKPKIPTGYSSILSIRDTQIAIKDIKNIFQNAIESKLNLTRVSAPMLVFSDSGLNDTLSADSERPIFFDVPNIGREAEVVQSLAKWKRAALKEYGFKVGEGIYADMNAIRRNEELDNIHSIYVDQWDWERIITYEERSIQTLIQTAKCFYDAIIELQNKMVSKFPKLTCYLPDNITEISTNELISTYPNLSEKEREYEICRKYGAVFLTQIGDEYGVRAPDYDDWSMNGDILFYYPVLDCAMEISSMGVRVDAEALRLQTKKLGCEEILISPYHQSVLGKHFPYTMGGGLGQSRLCMFLLGKAHIGEVQASIWSEEMLETSKQAGIHFL
jgi:aspartate--ammonia ligase